MTCHEPHGSALPKMVKQPYEPPHYQLCSQCHSVPRHNSNPMHGTTFAGRALQRLPRRHPWLVRQPPVRERIPQGPGLLQLGLSSELGRGPNANADEGDLDRDAGLDARRVRLHGRRRVSGTVKMGGLVRGRGRGPLHGAGDLQPLRGIRAQPDPAAGDLRPEELVHARPARHQPRLACRVTSRTAWPTGSSCGRATTRAGRSSIPGAASRSMRKDGQLGFQYTPNKCAGAVGRLQLPGARRRPPVVPGRDGQRAGRQLRRQLRQRAADGRLPQRPAGRRRLVPHVGLLRRRSTPRPTARAGWRRRGSTRRCRSTTSGTTCSAARTGSGELEDGDLDYTLSSFQYTAIVQPQARVRDQVCVPRQPGRRCLDGVQDRPVRQRPRRDLVPQVRARQRRIRLRDERRRPHADHLPDTGVPGTTFRPDRRITFRLDWADRVKKDQEELTLLKDIDASRIRVELEVAADRPAHDLGRLHEARARPARHPGLRGRRAGRRRGPLRTHRMGSALGRLQPRRRAVRGPVRRLRHGERHRDRARRLSGASGT